MGSAWAGKPCANPECGRKKGYKQRFDKFCFTCQRVKKRERSEAAHGKRTLETYGLTQEDYWALYEFQGRRCYACRWATGKARRLSVDHSHKCVRDHDPKMGCPSCVRGLLCRPCNNLLGMLRDSKLTFLRFVQYLIDPPYRRMKRGGRPSFVCQVCASGSEGDEFYCGLCADCQDAAERLGSNSDRAATLALFLAVRQEERAE